MTDSDMLNVPAGYASNVNKMVQENHNDGLATKHKHLQHFCFLYFNHPYQSIQANTITAHPIHPSLTPRSNPA